MSALTTSLCSMYQKSAWWAGQTRQELIVVEGVSMGFVVQGFVWLFSQHIFIFSLSVLSRSEGIWFRPAVWSTYYATDSGWWKPCCDLLEPVVGQARPLWSYINFLHFMDFFFLTNVDLHFLPVVLSFSLIYLFIDTFIFFLFFFLL